MTPKNAISLGRAFGIPIVLSNFLVLFVAVLMFAALLAGQSPLNVLAFITLLASVVLLHELGHSLTARHFGVKVSHITLTPLGGIAWMEGLPRDSRVEILVAIAGPAVNLVLAAVAAPLFLIGGPISVLAGMFIGINLALGLFNLIPAFPMDGGRVLRAYLARNGDWLAATQRAVSVGKALALVMGIAGIVYGQLTLPFIAVFIWAMGQKELFAMRVREMGAAWPFGGFSANPGGQAREAQTDQAQGGASENFTPPSEGPRRPAAAQEAQARSAPQGKGFSDDDIARLENSRGRLRRDWAEE